MCFKIGSSHLENTLTCLTIPKSSQRFFEQILRCEETYIPFRGEGKSIEVFKVLRCKCKS